MKHASRSKLLLVITVTLLISILASFTVFFAGCGNSTDSDANGSGEGTGSGDGTGNGGTNNGETPNENTIVGTWYGVTLIAPDGDNEETDGEDTNFVAKSDHTGVITIEGDPASRTWQYVSSSGGTYTYNVTVTEYSGYTGTIVINNTQLTLSLSDGTESFSVIFKK